MSAFVTIIGGSILALLLAGYYGQKYLPPPAPKIFGIDLGTTFSCIGAFHPGSGDVSILKNEEGQKCIPSVVAFDENGTVLVGYKATRQADQNPEHTFFDAKRFIGKQFSQEDFDAATKRYPFKMELTKDGFVRFISDRVVGVYLSPEQIGAEILKTLKKTAERHFMASLAKVVMSVPAEFDELQRAYTVSAGKLAELKVMRLINEPTAAALSYGLHNKTGVQDVLVVDLGGGTLDVSLLDIQGGMFLTRAMAGNNRLGGQDFNERLRTHITTLLENKIYKKVTDNQFVDEKKANNVKDRNSNDRHSITTDSNDRGKANSGNKDKDFTNNSDDSGTANSNSKEEDTIANDSNGRSSDTTISDPNDIQLLRNAVEDIKIALTFNESVCAEFKLTSQAGARQIFDHLYGYHVYSPDDSRGDGRNVSDDGETSLKGRDINGENGLPDEGTHSRETELQDGQVKCNVNNGVRANKNVVIIYIDRLTFNALNSDLFLGVLEPISRVIEEAELSPSDVEEVVLVGGSTRIPRVREIISEFFGGRRVRTDVDPEIAVAMGVSLQAGIMGGAWPLSVSALEVPYSAAKKIQLL